jgi:SAM-dependent methyltransferase
MALKNGIKSFLKSTSNAFYKAPTMHKIFYILFVLFIMMVFFWKKNDSGYDIDIEGFEVEGFEEHSTSFKMREGSKVYDDFYAKVYDELVFNKIKNDYELGSIVDSTKPTDTSIILDVGCGTGHHVSSLANKGYKVVGIDLSESMIKKAQETYPNLDFRVSDALATMSFPANSFTHITCLYFTIYYIKDKRLFFENCMHWLMPGGFLVLHLVNRDKFDPILPAGDPFHIVSPQKYADKRITTTNVKFDKFDYKANFELIPANNDTDDVNAILHETFKPFKKGGQIRKNEHKFYMPTQAKVLAMAKEAGFILFSQTDMIKCQYAHQFLYVLQKPN